MPVTEDELNLIKFRTGEPADTDAANNIARFNFQNRTLNYQSVQFGVSSVELDKKADSSAVTETLKAYAKKSEIPTDYLTSADKTELQGEIDQKTTMGEVEGKGYITEAALDGYATTAFTNTTYQPKGDYVTSDYADENLQPKGDYALKSEIPSDYLTSADKTELQGNIDAKTTMSEVEAKGYATTSFTDTTYQPKGNYALKSEIPTDYLTSADKTELQGNIDAKTTIGEVEAKGYITDAALDGYATTAFTNETYQPKGDFLTTADKTELQENIDAKTTMSEVEAKGYITEDALNDYATTAFTNETYQPKGNYALTGDIPTKVSQLTNDSKFITSSSTVANANKVGNLTPAEISAMTNNTNLLENGAGFITTGDIPTSNTAFTNDAEYITTADIPTNVSEFTNDANYITTAATVAQANKVKASLTMKVNGTQIGTGTYNGSTARTYDITVPTKISDLTNDSEFITTAATVANANTVDSLTPAQISAMTNNTNKLTNGAGYITKSVNNLDNYYTKTSIDTLMSSKLERTTASTLPTTGAANTVYMIPKSTAGTNDAYDEYMYINSAWEHIGSSEVDLSNYYTKDATSSKTEISTALAGKSDTGHTHANYALTSHTHSNYSLTNHTHSNYALTSHTHSNYSLTSHTHDYLPLSGGTVTGLTTIQTTDAHPLMVNRNTDGGSSIQFLNSTGVLGELGVTSQKVPYFYDTQARTILHSGNSAHTHNYLPSGQANLTASTGTLSIGNNNAQYHFVMGTGATYGWFDLRNSANTMVNAFQMGPDATTFSKPIKASVFSGNVSGTATNSISADMLDGKHASDFALTSHTHDYSNTYAAKSHTHDYLPLSGGTVSGATTISSATFNPLTIFRSGANNAVIRFENGSGYRGALGVYNDGKPYYHDSGTTSYELLHSGNSAHTHNDLYVPLSGEVTVTGKLVMPKDHYVGNMYAGNTVSGWTKFCTLTYNGTYGNEPIMMDIVGRSEAFRLVFRIEGTNATSGSFTTISGGVINYMTTGTLPFYWKKVDNKIELYKYTQNTYDNFSVTKLHLGAYMRGKITDISYASSWVTSSAGMTQIPWMNLQCKMYGTAEQAKKDQYGNALSMMASRRTGIVGSDTASLSNYWCKIASVTGMSNWSDVNCRFILQSTLQDYGTTSSAFRVGIRQYDATSAGTLSCYKLDGNFQSDRVRVFYSNYAGFEIWVNCAGCYNRVVYQAEVEGSRIDMKNYITTYNTTFSAVQTTSLSKYINPTDTFATASHTHAYLPLAGGTVTGTTTFSASGYGESLVVNRDKEAGFDSVVTFKNNAAVLGKIGFSGSNDNAYIQNSAGTNHILVHDGNSAHTHANYALTSHTHDYSATYAAKSHTHDYLPLAGGTVSGKTTFSGSNVNHVKILRASNTNGAFIEYDNTVGTLGYIGVGGSGSDYPLEPMFGTSAKTWSRILHTGNSAHTHTSDNISDKLTATGVQALGWNEIANQQKLLSMARIAYWNGAYSGTASNLAYCNKGAFGTMATQDTGSYSTATQVNTALAGKAASTHNHDSAYVAKSGDIMTGRLVINPNGASNFSEGVRVNQATNGWALVQLGGAANSTNGTTDGSWIIGRRGSTGTTYGAVGDLVIQNNGSGGDGVTVTKNGSIVVNGSINTASVLRLGQTLVGPSSNTGGVTQQYNSTTQALEFVFN